MQATNEATQEQLLAELSKLTTEQVLELLLMIRTGVNEKIQYATLHLRLYSKTPQSIETFLKIICSEQPLGVRQLASILIDRSLKQTFLDLSPEVQDAVKASLLDRYFKEPERLVRKSLAHNITMIVKYLFDMDKNWDDLLKILANQFTNGNDLVKEVTLSLMSSLFDKCGDMFTEHHSAMMELLSTTIINSTGKVQTEALRCWAFLLEALDEEEGKLPPTLFHTLPQILGVLSQLIMEEREEDLLYDVFDMFVLLIEEDRSMLDPQLPSLIEFIANPKILMNQNLNVNLRSMLIELLCMITETKRTLYSRNPKMLELTVTAMCQTTMDPTKIEDYYSYDEVVMDGLGKMADNLPRKKFYPVLLEVVKKMLISMDEIQIANAFKVLGAVSEGCADFIAKDLNTIMTSWVVEAMKSGSDRIREAVTRMLSHFVSYVNPDIQLYHKQLVEFFCSSLGLLNPRIAEKALMGLDVFCHQTEKEQIAEHVDLLTRTFMTIIQNPEVTLKMRTISLSALESLIRSAEKLFEPYFNDTHTIVSQFLQISDLKDLSVRAGATAVMASLCKVFCPGNIELFKAGFSNLTKIIYQGLVTHEDHELSEASFEYFSAMAEAVGPLFEEVLDELIVPVFSMAEKIMKLTPTESNPNALAADSDDEDETAPSRKDYFATQPFLSSKASAIYAIGSFAEACPTHFVAKYFARATKIIDDVWNFNYHAVREHAGRSLVCLAKALAIAHNGGKPLPTEENVPRGTPATPYTEEVQNFIESEVMHKLLQSILEDRDILVVTSSFQQICELAHALGSPALASHQEQIAKVIELMLSNELSCHRKGANEDDDDDEVHSQLFIATMDLMIISAEFLQLAWVKPSTELYPKFLKYTQKEKIEIIDEVTEVIGCYTSLLEHTPTLANEIGLSFCDLILSSINHNDDQLNRNGAYGIGVLFEIMPQALLNQLPSILVYLKKIMDTAELLPVKENVLAAAARIYMATNGSGIPLPDLMKMISELSPFQNDKDEFQTIVRLYIYIAASNTVALETYFGTILEAFLVVICYADKYKMKKTNLANLRLVMLELVKHEKYKAAVEQKCATLKPEELAAVQKFIA